MAMLGFCHKQIKRYEMSLKDKLKKLRDSSDDSKIDWEQTKNKWIDSVNHLFKIIQDDWFSELENEGLLTIQIFPISITEEHIGPYSINKMEITFARDSIVLEPVGRNIIGGEGRIDFYLKGEFGKGVMLILFREKEKDNWFLVYKQNRRQRELFSRKSLEKVIEQWIEE